MNKKQLSLAEKTRQYWNLSRIWYGIPGTRSISTGEALHRLNNVTEQLNPNRPLAIRVFNLKSDIILGKDLNDDKAIAG